ncbi:hypothetical protein BOX15_Mlig009892g1 [Macrostomum lignano]|uniref:Myotubularin phosphatase domain-containing protein n=2 Tax=Macrostomum lignano TaxID=282301 RepID=A0A267EIC4_9PLAT|nr:hypothetical protein BOX15_Mlig009892g1 [Macrostomum lignano]
MAAASGRTGSDPAARRGSPAKSSKPSAASTKALEQPSQQQDHQRRRQEFKTVPPGQRLEDLLLPPTQQQFSSSADIHRQKLQILELCVKNVFERRIADAKKSLKAVKRDLAHRSSRLRLVDLLNDMVVARGMSTLDQQQFEIACELLVQALRFDAQHEEWLCALRCLPLLERLRCQLPCQNSTASLELQASMTEEVQACTAWSSEAFWHWAFSRFVQTQLCDYYVGRLAEWKPDEPVDPSATALDIVAKVMQHSEQLSTAELEELKKIEEETVESAAKHFIVILAALRMPLEPAKRRWAGGGGNRRDVGVSELSSTNQGGGGPGGGSSQTESQESQHQQHHQASQSQAEREANAAAAKLSEQFARELEAWIRDRFLDRVCSENGLSQSQINSLKRTLHEFLHSVHMESLDNIWAEYCKIPKSQKARITRPALLPGERLLMPQLRAYLYPDGRRDPVRLELESCETADYLHHQTLTAATAVSAAVVVAGAPATAAEFTPDIGWLPAEGLFLATNYRLIFKGVPSNVLQSEKTIVRCFPIAALHKAKELSKSERDPALLASVQNRHSVRQQVLFKSGTFEAMKIGFDAGEDEISELLERIRSARHPGSVREIFALSADGGRLVGDLDDEFADTPLPVTASAAAAALPTTAMEASATGTGAGSSGGVKIKKPKKLHSKPYTLTRRLAKQTTSAAHAAANKLMTLRPGAAGVSSHRQHQQEHQWRSSLRPPPSPAAPGSAAIPGSERSSMHDSDEAIAARFSGYSGATSRHHQPSRPTSELLRDTLETPGYEDLHRLGLLGKQLTDAICLRICCANFEHDLVSSYPAVLIVPRAVTDKSLRRLTKAHRQCRFPVVVWRCHSNGALLFRSGSFQGKSLAWAGGLGSVGGGTTAAADGAEVGRFSEEQERLFQALSACAHASSLAGCIATGSNHDAAADDAIQSSADALSEGDELADDSKEILAAAVAPVGDNGDDGDSSVSNEPPMSNSDSNDEYHDVEEAPGVEVGDEAAAGPSSAGVDKQPLSPMLEEDSSGLSDIVDSRQDRGDGINDFSSRRRGHGVGVGGGGNNQLDRLFSSVRSGAAKLKKSESFNLTIRRTRNFFATIRRKKSAATATPTRRDHKARRRASNKPNRNQYAGKLPKLEADEANHLGRSLTLSGDASSSFGLSNRNNKNLTLNFGSRSPASMGPDSRLSSSSLEPVVGSGSQTKIHLYIFTDRSAVAKIRAHRIEGAELVPIDDYPTAHAIRDSYKRLIKVCLPGKPLPLYSTTGGAGKSKKSFLHAFEDTKWLNLVQCLLDLAGAVVNLVACQARSVLLALEDGWDSTAAVLSLSQIMLDQHYRTIAGFRSLLEKDWLLFGHQFDARFGRLKGPESGHFAPVFLLFLDSVHQLLHQFPLSFEFNQHFLLTLAYHTVGCRFANFLGNCELDRLYADIGSADFWAYLDTQMAVSTAYLNLAYAPEMAAAAAGEGSANRQSRKQNKQQRLTAVLRPVTAQALLQRWTYFTREEAAYGASADPDLYSQERRWHLAATEAKSASSMKDAAAVAAEAAAAAEQQLDRQQQQQQAVDEEVELGYNYYADGASKLGSAIEELAAINGIDCLDVWHRLHRKATSIRLRHQRRRRRQNSPSALIALGGADGGDANAAAAAIAAKRWHIDQSRQLLSRALLNTSAAATPVTSTAASTTTAAGMAASVVSGPTPPVRPPPPQILTPSAPEPTRTSPEDVESAASPFVAAPQRPPIRPPPPKRPSSTMSTMPLSTKPTLGSGSLEATLHKQGKLLKQWAPRQFVLDPVRHQLRYWDAHRDPSGSRASELSLAELHSVRLSGRAPAGAPSKVPEAAFFELVKSNQRVIRLYANTPKLATEWVEKLSSAISQ